MKKPHVSTFGCSYDFSEGTPMTVKDKVNQFANWDIKSDLYVKCKDSFGNEPLPDQCSITVRASDF